MTHCPRCHHPLDRSTQLLKDRLILRCQPCRKFAVEPPEGIAWEWLDGGPGLLERLAESDRRARQTAAIVGSEGDDPRWTEVMV